MTVAIINIASARNACNNIKCLLSKYGMQYFAVRKFSYIRLKQLVSSARKTTDELVLFVCLLGV